MPIRPFTPADLEHLVCPVCHHILALESPTIRCTGCARLFPIVDGLPVLLATRATS